MAIIAPAIIDGALLALGIGGFPRLVGISAGSLSTPFLTLSKWNMRLAIDTFVTIGLPIYLVGTLGCTFNSLHVDILPVTSVRFL